MLGNFGNVANVEMLPMANSQFDGGGKLDIGTALACARLDSLESRIPLARRICWLLDIGYLYIQQDKIDVIHPIWYNFARLAKTIPERD